MRKSTSGFTIVELLIVIVVIAILAAISVVAYNGIRQRAVTSAYTSAVDQWEKLLRAELALRGPLPSVSYACLGKSAADFPDLQDGFTAGSCVRVSSGVSYSYNNSYFSGLEMQNSMVNGLLPVSTWSMSGVTYVSRGILLSVNTSNIMLMWFPQVTGQCGRGMSVMGGEAGLLTGDYCALYFPNR